MYIYPASLFFLKTGAGNLLQLWPGMTYPGSEMGKCNAPAAAITCLSDRMGKAPSASISPHSGI